MFPGHRETDPVVVCLMESTMKWTSKDFIFYCQIELPNSNPRRNITLFRERKVYEHVVSVYWALVLVFSSSFILRSGWVPGAVALPLLVCSCESYVWVSTTPHPQASALLPDTICRSWTTVTSLHRHKLYPCMGLLMDELESLTFSSHSS